MTPSERWLALTLAAGPGGMRGLRAALDAFGSPEGVLAAGAEALQAGCGLSPERAKRLAGAADSPAFKIESRLVAEQGVQLVPWDDPEYPAALRGLSSAPLLLYVQGARLSAALPAPVADGARALSLAVVGTRTPSRYGEQQTRALIADLARAEPRLTIVSGLARGVDGIAHEAALAAGLNTLAVMAGGLNRVYPPEHADLAARVRRQGGLLTEFAMAAPPLPQNFPVRNRIIAGLAKVLLIVEAGRQSGSLITAGQARAYGRHLLALPGHVDAAESRGTNYLIQSGQAKLVMDAGDILAALEGRAPDPLTHAPRVPARKLGRGTKSSAKTNAGKEDAPDAVAGKRGVRRTAHAEPGASSAVRNNRPLPAGLAPDGPAARMLLALREGPQHPDDLAVAAGLSIEQVLGVLLELELTDDVVKQGETAYALP